jgi:N-acetylglutamate synthase-like GNAT family acetyltransferase
MEIEMFTIRDAKVEDDISIAEITETHSGPINAQKAVRQFYEMFKNGYFNPHYYVAEIEEKVVGYAGFRDMWIAPDTYELVWINVKKGFEGLGIGRELTLKRIEHIKSLDGSLIMLMTHKPKFFEKLGFKITNTFDDWHLMHMNLKKIKSL